MDTQSADPQSADPQSADPQSADPESVDPESVDPESVDPDGRGGQGRLPLTVEEAPAGTRPAGPEPIPYSLTAKARRVVAPESLPRLSVIRGTQARQPALDAPAGEATDGAEEPTGDTRRARARALCRAGMPWSDIAAEIDVDPALVRAWVDEVAPTGSGRAPADRSDRGPDAGPREREDGMRRIFEAARQRAAGADRPPDGGDAGRPAALGLLAGALEIDARAVVLTTSDRGLAGAVVDRLRAEFGVGPEDLRVVLRIGPRVAGDRASAEWGRVLGVPPERITPTRWTTAPRPDTAEVLLRVTDPEIAGAVAGCRDRVLDGLGGDGGSTQAHAEVPLGA